MFSCVFGVKWYLFYYYNVIAYSVQVHELSCIAKRSDLIDKIYSFGSERRKNHGVLRIGESKKYFFKHKISTRLLRTWYERAFRVESGTVP